jgi:hypothetical protein
MLWTSTVSTNDRSLLQGHSRGLVDALKPPESELDDETVEGLDEALSQSETRQEGSASANIESSPVAPKGNDRSRNGDSKEIADDSRARKKRRRS